MQSFAIQQMLTSKSLKKVVLSENKVCYPTSYILFPNYKQCFLIRDLQII